VPSGNGPAQGSGGVTGGGGATLIGSVTDGGSTFLGNIAPIGSPQGPGGSSQAPGTSASVPSRGDASVGLVSGLSFGHGLILWPLFGLLDLAALAGLVVVVRRRWTATTS
jgi:hypothetical protein